MNTDCRKCKAAMPLPPKSSGKSPIDRIEMKITDYRCPHCGHWNNLKSRKKR